MTCNKLTREQMWSRQQISSLDVDYDFWNRERESIRQAARVSKSCLFVVDVFKGRYDFASESFSDVFGYNLSRIKRIERNGDFLEERIHPDDRDKMIDIQIKHSQFIYSLPVERRNDYRNLFQYRVLNARGRYVNVISRQEVIQTDKNGKAWMVMGMMDLSPDQTPFDGIRYSFWNKKTGEMPESPLTFDFNPILTDREIVVLQLICRGLLSKEIADKLNISIHTVNNHRKNILMKLQADNSIEAINRAREKGLLA